MSTIFSARATARPHQLRSFALSNVSTRTLYYPTLPGKLSLDHQIITYFRLRAAGLYAAYRPPSTPRQCRLSHSHGRWHPDTRLRGTRVYSTGHAGRFRSPCLQGRPKKTLTYCPNPLLMPIILTNRLIVKVTWHSCLCRL